MSKLWPGNRGLGPGGGGTKENFLEEGAPQLKGALGCPLLRSVGCYRVKCEEELGRCSQLAPAPRVTLGSAADCDVDEFLVLSTSDHAYL